MLCRDFHHWEKPYLQNTWCRVENQLSQATHHKKIMYIRFTKLWSLYSQRSEGKSIGLKWTKGGKFLFHLMHWAPITSYSMMPASALPVQKTLSLVVLIKRENNGVSEPKQKRNIWNRTVENVSLRDLLALKMPWPLWITPWVPCASKTYHEHCVLHLALTWSVTTQLLAFQKNPIMWWKVLVSNHFFLVLQVSLRPAPCNT